MPTVHMTLQGKGGVGKTFVAAILAQFLTDQAQVQNQTSGAAAPLRLIDTDPVNGTFTQYKAWPVESLVIQDDGSTRINERRFDALMEALLTDEADFVIDNGAATFVPLSNYLIEHDAFALLAAAGRRVCIHPVITGGQGLIDTMNGFDLLAKQLPPEAELIVWLNPYFGPIESGGKKFTEMAAFKRHKDRVRAVIEIPAHSADTFGADLAEMLQRKMTFDEAVASDAFSIMSRQRLTMVRRRMFERVGEVLAA